MSSLAIVAIAIGILLVLLAVRVPVAFALLASGAAGILMLQGAGVATSVLGRVPYDTPSKYVLVILPLFIAMGVFAKHSALAEDAFWLASRWLRKVPGGLAVATVFACAGFAAVSGSSPATVAAIGPIAAREMRRYGYDNVVTAGVIGAAGTLGVLIPPSLILVLYGIMTGESIGALLVAGVVPGIVSAVLYAAAIILRFARRPQLATAMAPAAGGDPVESPGPSTLGSENPVGSPASPPRRRVAGSVLRIALLFAVVVGGVYTGWMSATEAAASAACLGLIMFLWELRRERNGRHKLRAALDEAVSLSAMIFALLIGGAVFTYFLVAARVPSTFASFAVSLDVPGYLTVMLLLLAFVPLGMFLDPLSTMLVAVPLAYPVVSALGYDGVWFGILVVKMIEVGLITPPVGINAFVVAGSAPGISVEEAFRGVLWFLPVDLITIALIFLVPEIVTWLPALMMR